MDLRIVVPAAAAWLAAILLLPFPGAFLPVVLAAFAAAVGFLVAGRVAARPALVVVAVSCAAIALVLTSALASSDARRPAVISHSHELTDAVVTTTQTVTHASTYFAATLIQTGDERMSVPVMVFRASPRERVEIGTRLRVSGTLQRTTPEDEVSFLIFARDPAVVVGQPPWYLTWANGLRSGFSQASTSLPGDGGELLPGLAIGDTVAVSPALKADMKTSSLSHLTAVSGANCAVIIGLILLAGKALGLPRGLRVGSAVVVLVGFVVLVTPQPSVLRSAVMAAIVLAALARGRPLAGLPVVGVSALVLLTIDPWLADDYGFALSVLATAGLMAFSGPITRRLSRFVPHWIALIIAIPLAAQLACQPVLILLSPSLPLYGVLANTLAEPASPAATVLGLLACVLLPLLPAAGHVAAAIAWVPSAWIAAVATFFAGLPGARLPWPGGLPGAAILAVVTCVLLWAALGTMTPRLRRILVVSLVSVVGMALASTSVIGVIAAAGRPSDWQIANCDIGQGDAMLVRSEGKVALMDTGPSIPLLRNCLSELGITRINLLVLSHYDLDHVAGTPAVDDMTERALVGPSSGQPRDRQIINGLLAGGAPRSTGSAKGSVERLETCAGRSCGRPHHCPTASFPATRRA